MSHIDREKLRRLPKAELHCHLDGSVRATTLFELASEQGVGMPARDPDSLAHYMKLAGGSSLESYLERFETTLAVMQQPDALERVAYELAEDAHADGVLYLETRFAPILNVRRGLQLPDVLDAVLRGLARAESEFGLMGRVIVTALRTLPPSVSLELAELAVAYRDRGVVGFDLAGAERGHPASIHAAAFEHARGHDVACTCHAGEGDGAESVRDALRSCCPNRLGHATRLYEDSSLMDFVNDRRIPVEICLTSNVQTRAAASYAAHPLRRYFDAGLAVCLNTDNRLMSGTTLTDEYAHAASHLGFTFPQLAQLSINGFESAFLHWDERRALITKARNMIDRPGLSRA